MRFDRRQQPTPLAKAYEKDLVDGHLDDPIQRRALQSLSRVADDLSTVNSISHSVKSILGKIICIPSLPHRGLYLWGGVGRGKTYLMDLFFEWVPLNQKKRLHFHRFMSFVHTRLRELRGQPSPLHKVAAEFSRDTRLLCFDEFFVSDIGDAMILSELLAGLFEHEVFLIATSNTKPDRLYEDGLHRDRFLPAIALIKQHNEILELAGPTDYRLATLRRSELYRLVYPVTEETIKEDQSLLVPHERLNTSALNILNRDIQTVFHTNGVAAFRFDDVCETPRNAADYIEIASLFHTVVIYDIPTLTLEKENAARRFIALVDEFYERRVNAIFCAEEPVETLYQGHRLLAEVERTKSRIFEMQSEQYLSQPHRP